MLGDENFTLSAEDLKVFELLRLAQLRNNPVGAIEFALPPQQEKELPVILTGLSNRSMPLDRLNG